MTAPKLIVFDMDGTLIDSQNVIVAAMDAAFEKCGLVPPDRAATLGIVGLSLPEAMAVLAPETRDDIRARLVDAYKGGFVDRRTRGETAEMYPGARACLHDLNTVSEAVLGVATGKAQRGVDHAVETHDLHGLFVTSQTADTNPSKPHPGMLLSACTETGIAPVDAVMIGDTSFDMEMGKAAGLGTIAVSWGYHDRARLAHCRPDRIVDDFAQLRRAIAELTGVDACLVA